MNEPPRILMGEPEIEQLIRRIARELRQRLDQRRIADPLMVGIHTGGVWVATRLHELLGLREPPGVLDISFYRDDFTRIGMNPQVRPSSIPVSVDDRHIVLVDDVLQTGRTIRAALNEIFDYGRPASVLLVTLVERSGRELPIHPDVVGLRPELGPREHITLTGPSHLTLVASASKRQARSDSSAPGGSA